MGRIDLPDRQARRSRSTFFAYLVARSAGRLRASGRSTATVGGEPSTSTIRAWAGRPGVGRAGRRPRRARPAGARRADRAAAGRATAALIVQEAVSRSTGGYAGLFDPAAGLVEIAYYADDFVVLHEAAHAWFNGALLADRWANEAFASYYGLEVAAALERQGRPADELTPTSSRRRASRSTPGARSGARTTRHEDYAYAATLALAEEIAERAGAEWPAARSGPTPPAGIGAYQPADRRARPRSAGRARDRRRTARLARPARPARGTAPSDLRRPVADLGRARRPTCRCSTRGRPPGRATTTCVERGRRLARCRGRPRRDAGVAVRRRRRTLLDDADGGPRPARGHRGGRGRGRADRRRTRCATASRTPTGSTTRHAEATAELDAIERLRRRRRAPRPAESTPLEVARPVGQDARGGPRRGARRCSRRATSRGSRSAPARPRPSIWVGGRGRSVRRGIGIGQRSCSRSSSCALVARPASPSARRDRRPCRVPTGFGRR